MRMKILEERMTESENASYRRSEHTHTHTHTHAHTQTLNHLYNGGYYTYLRDGVTVDTNCGEFKTGQEFHVWIPGQM